MRDTIISLQESVEELGFETIQEALDAGYEADYEKGELIGPQEQAHKEWLKERYEILSIIESVKEDIVDLNGGDNNHVAIDELNNVIDFIERGEV